jgi:transposase
MSLADVEETRRYIAAALARPLKAQVRSRLVAIDTVLSGQRVEEAAVSARVRPSTVKTWLRVVTYNGIDATLDKWKAHPKPRPQLLDADPVTLRELAAKERNPRIRKRMLALACVAEGMNPHAASMSTGLNHQAIAARIRRFRQEGVAAFQDRKIAGRPCKLAVAQSDDRGGEKGRAGEGAPSDLG